MIVRAGTSGFSFDAWKGPFYPDKIAGSKMLAFYAERLGTVEINNTFYKLPTEKMLSDWAAQVPPSFRFSLKASRYLTHRLRLKDPKEPIDRFFGLAKALGERLGPVLVQLPPFVRKDVPLLADFVAQLPAGKLVAMEFRHASWRDDAVYAEMRRGNVAWVGSEADDEPLFLADTADWAYLRLRKTLYSNEDIAAWAGRLRAAGKDTYAYFKHEDDGLGPKLAATLARAVADAIG